MEPSPSQPPSKPGSSQPISNSIPAKIIKKEPAIPYLFWIYLQLCIPGFVLFVLAQTNAHFLAMTLPFPMIVLFSIPVTHISHTGNKKKQNSHLKTKNISTNDSPNAQIENQELSQDDVDRKKQQENELPQQQNVQEPEELGQESADTCTSTLTLFRVILCLMLLYEYHFDFIDQLPISSCSHRLVLAVIFRVQSSLIILSMSLLHPKIVSSLIFTFNSADIDSDFALKTLRPASVGTFFHIFRLRTNKHKKQQLVLMKNWKSALNKILNFKEIYYAFPHQQR